MSEQHPDTEPTENNPFFRLGGQQYIRLYYFMPEEHLLDLIINDEIKVSIPDECNDPLEFLPAGNDDSIDKEQRDCGLISFSSHFGSSLMWAHYADSHRGVCIQFDFPISSYGYIDNKATENLTIVLGRQATSNNIQLNTSPRYALLDTVGVNLNQFQAIESNGKCTTFFIEVNYAKKRPSRAKTNMVYATDKKGVTALGIAKDFHTKSDEWSYEKEWRLLINLEESEGFHDGAFFVKGLTKYISMIILGMKFPKRPAIMEHCINRAFKKQILNKPPYLSPQCVPVCKTTYHEEDYKIILD